MASQILKTLESAEEAWRAKSPEWKRKIGRWEAWKTRQKNNERLVQKLATRKRDPDGEMLREGEHQSWESYFDLKDPSPQFSFAGTSAYTKEELLEDIDSLSWTSTPDFLYRALRRGIAVHHSGMNKTYRVLVERYVSPSRLLKYNGFKYLLDFSVLASFESSSQQVRYYSNRDDVER